MPDQATSTQSALDLTRIQDPDIRRVIRALEAEYSAKLAHLEAGMEAMLEILLEKHVGSVSEFRRMVVKLQQDQTKANRLHEVLTGGAPGAPVPRSLH